jgi:hypothetical protein
MDDQVVTQALSNQYQRTLTMLREAINAFPADQWRVVEKDYPRPAAMAYHVLESIDYYISGKNSDEFQWGYRFGLEWWAKEFENLPSQESMLTYLDEIETKIIAWLNQMDFSAPVETYTWTGDTRLENAIYVLRHTHQHTAELSLELHNRGLTSPEWI